MMVNDEPRSHVQAAAIDGDDRDVHTIGAGAAHRAG
jgi:hypothetical protein